MKSSVRQLLAFVAAPALLPLANALYLYFIKGAGIVAFDVTLGLVLPLSYAIWLLLGIPCHFALKRWRRTGLSAYALLGLGLGMVSSLLFVDAMAQDWGKWLVDMRASFVQQPVSQLLALMEWWIFGLVGLMFFWLIARPDRLDASAPVNS